MKQSILPAAVLAIFLVGTPLAYGQKAAEQFIPLGQSPGLSGKQTLIGRIEAVDPLSGSVTLAGAAGEARQARVTQATHIWLDRSLLQLINARGVLADLVPGRRAEIKFTDANRREAEWVKVELTAP